MTPLEAMELLDKHAGKFNQDGWPSGVIRAVMEAGGGERRLGERRFAERPKPGYAPRQLMLADGRVLYTRRAPSTHPQRVHGDFDNVYSPDERVRDRRVQDLGPPNAR